MKVDLSYLSDHTMCQLPVCLFEYVTQLNADRLHKRRHKSSTFPTRHTKQPNGFLKLTATHQENLVFGFVKYKNLRLTFPHSLLPTARRASGRAHCKTFLSTIKKSPIILGGKHAPEHLFRFTIGSQVCFQKVPANQGCL